MLLAIDAGNTNIVFAVFDDNGEIRGEWRSSSEAKRTADEFGIWLKDLMGLEGLEQSQIKAAIIATVVPEQLFSLKTLCQKYFNCEALIIGEAGVDLGIKVLTDQPSEVGADRLVNTVSAFERYGGPLIVVDFGTATTFDVIDENGSYCGGVIAPGTNLSLEALYMAAAKLPRVAVERPELVIGKGTIKAMQSGIYWGYVSMIEGMVRRIKDEFGADMEVIATGGLAPLFVDATDCLKCADGSLTLRGLLAIYRRNRKG